MQNFSHWRPMLRVNREFPESVARLLMDLPVQQAKHRILTENGLTLAEEERILALNLEETTHAMSTDEALLFLKNRHCED